MKNVRVGWGPVGMTIIKEPSKPKLELNRISYTGEKNSEFKLVINSKYEELPVWQSSNENVAEVDQDGNVTLLNEGTAIITVTSGKLIGKCVIKVVLSKEQQFIKDMQQGGNVKLTSNITLSTPVQIKNTVVLDLNGHDIIMSAEGQDAIWVLTGGNLTINGEGNIVGTYYSLYAGGDAKVEINGGNFVGVAAAIFAQTSAVVEINDGRYEAYNEDPNYGPHDYTLNLKDNTNAKILVKGGQFYKFNPANNTADGPETNYVAENYRSEQKGDYWVVSKVPSAPEQPEPNKLDTSKIYYGAIVANKFSGYSNLSENDIVNSVKEGTISMISVQKHEGLKIPVSAFYAAIILIPENSNLKAFKSELAQESTFFDSQLGQHSNGDINIGDFKVYGELYSIINGGNTDYFINIHE